MSLREPPAEASPSSSHHPRVGVGRHPAGAGNAEGEAAHARVRRLRAGPRPSPAQTGGPGVSHQTQTQAGIWRLWSILNVSKFYAWTG